MQTPDPDGMTLLGKALGALAVVGAAVVAPLWKGRTWVEKRLATKADKEATDRALEHIERLYQNAEVDRRQTRDLHDKAMEAVREGQRQIIDILTRR